MRRKLLLKLAELVAERAPDLSRIATEDMGMPVAFTLGEALFTAEGKAAASRAVLDTADRFKQTEDGNVAMF